MPASRPLLSLGVASLILLACSAASSQELVHRFQAGPDILYAEGTHNNGRDKLEIQAVGVDARYLPSVRITPNLRLAGELSVGFAAPGDVQFNGETRQGNLTVSAFGGGGLLWDGGAWYSALTVVYGASKESVAADGSEWLTIGAFPMVRLATGVRLVPLGRGHLELILSGGIGFPEGRYSAQEWTLARASVALGFAR